MEMCSPAAVFCCMPSKSNELSNYSYLSFGKNPYSQIPHFAIRAKIFSASNNFAGRAKEVIGTTGTSRAFLVSPAINLQIC